MIFTTEVGSVEKLLRRYLKYKKECTNLGLKQIPLKKAEPGMILYCPKPSWSKVGYGWIFKLSFPKRYERFRVISKNDKLEVSVRLIGSKKVIHNIGYLGVPNYVWVLRSSIK